MAAISTIIGETPGDDLPARTAIRFYLENERKAQSFRAANDDDWEALWPVLQAFYQIETIAPAAQEYIRESIWIDYFEGPAQVRGAAHYLGQTIRFQKPYLKKFPAFAFDSNTWLLLTTGQVLTLNHEGSFRMVVNDLEIELERAGGGTRDIFLQRLSEAGSIFSLEEYLRLNLCLQQAGYGDGWDVLDKNRNRLFLRAVREIKGISHAQLEELVFGSGPASFLYECAMAFLEDVENGEAMMSDIEVTAP